MVVTTPPGNETERHLDELNVKVDAGFSRVDTDIRELRGEIKSSRAELKGEIQELRAEIASLNRTLTTAAVAIVVALVGSNAL
jgi:uncharacterized coiled-coil DUF342 family protein